MGRHRTRPYCSVCDKPIINGVAHKGCGSSEKPVEKMPEATPSVEKPKPVEAKEVEKAVGDMSVREWAQAVGRATKGYKIYLNGIDGKLYWSDYQDDDERDDPDGKLFATPMMALKHILKAVDFLLNPDGSFLIVVHR